MNKTISGLMLALLAIAGAAPSFAAERDRGTSARQQFNQPRMQQGTRSGETMRSPSGGFQRGTGTTRQFDQRSRGESQVAQAGRQDGSQRFNRPSGDAQRERHDGDRRWAGQQDHRRHADGDGRRHGWDNNRGHHYGRDNNRGHHYGWANNRGHHYGWDSNRGRHYGWDNNRGHHNGHDGFRGRPTYGWDRSIDRRQEHQRERIVQGLRSGEVTRHEAQRLFAEQRDLRQQERAFRSDGVLSPWERREMHQDLNAAGRHIYNETHDAQQRF